MIEVTTHELNGYSDEVLPLIRVINFGHPLTEKNITEIQAKITPAHIGLYHMDVQIDRSRPVMEVAAELVNAVPLTPKQWTEPLIINPPGLSPLALAIMLEVQRRCGYFADFLVIRPVTTGFARGFEVAEIATAPSSWWIR